MDEEEILKRAQELSQPEPIQEEKQEDKKGMSCNIKDSWGLKLRIFGGSYI